jgi:uncharacterized protein
VTGAWLCTGHVSHARMHAAKHAFRYPLYMLLADLDALESVNRNCRLLGYNRRRVLGLHDADHFDGQPLGRAVRAAVEQAGHGWPGGRVLALTHPRVFGYVFNPISLFYCFDTHDRLETVVAEVSNTYGERHAYVLPGHAAMGPSPGACRWTAKKVFHVSPFFSMDGTYRFEIASPGERVDVGIDLEVGGQRRFAARLQLRTTPLADRALLGALMRYPLMTVQVMAAIHVEAARLWWKGVEYLPKPAYAPEAARRTPP